MTDDFLEPHERMGEASDGAKGADTKAFRHEPSGEGMGSKLVSVTGPQVKLVQ